MDRVHRRRNVVDPGSWRRTHARQTLCTRAGDPTEIRTKIEPCCQLCRSTGYKRETFSELRTQVLHHGPQVVDQRTHLVNEWIRPGARSLQERTRHVFGEMRSDLFEARGI